MLEIKEVSVLSVCIFAVTSAWRLACLISLCQCFGFLVFLWFFAQEEISRHSQSALEGLSSSSVPLMTQFGDGGTWVGVGHVAPQSPDYPFTLKTLSHFPHFQG